MKNLHTQDHYGLRPEAKEFPMMVVLSFTYVCNADCPNCPYNNSTIRGKYKDALYMPEDIFKKIADECAQHRSLIRISGGGEPMLHPKAIALIMYAINNGAKIGLITNGSKFDFKDLETLISAGIDAIEFSVDAGNAETYSQVRPGLSWEILNNNIEFSVKFRNQISSKTRIIASIINQEGVDINSAEQYWQNIVDKVQVRKFLTWGINKDNSADSSSYLPPHECIPCPWLFERLNVDSRGDVTLCGEDIAFNEKFANIKNTTIFEIWHGKQLNYFRNKHLSGHGNDIVICSKCPDWKFRSWNYNYWKILTDADRKREHKK